MKHSEKADLLDRFVKFLQKNGYIDSDANSEEPFAIDLFLAGERKILEGQRTYLEQNGPKV